MKKVAVAKLGENSPVAVSHSWSLTAWARLYRKFGCLQFLLLSIDTNCNTRQRTEENENSDSDSDQRSVQPRWQVDVWERVSAGKHVWYGSHCSQPAAVFSSSLGMLFIYNSNLHFTSLSSMFSNLLVNLCQSLKCAPLSSARSSADSAPAVWRTAPSFFFFCFASGSYQLHLVFFSSHTGSNSRSISPCSSPLPTGDFVDLYRVPPESPLFWSAGCSSSGLRSETALYFESCLVFFSAPFQFCCIISWSEGTRSTHNIHSIDEPCIYPVV